MKRREFIPKAIIGSSIIAAVPLLTTSCEDDPVTPDNNNNMNPGDSNEITVNLTDSNYSALNNQGGFAYAGDIVIINTDGSNFAAMSKICTHNGCTVNYNSSLTKLQCPCHGSEFSTMGSVLKGPASSALETYSVSREGDILTIS